MENQKSTDFSVRSDLDDALKLFNSTPRKNKPQDLCAQYETEKFRFEWCKQNQNDTGSLSMEYLVKEYSRTEDVSSLVKKEKSFDVKG
ncbi:MAG TPA: hypothetical protein VHP54_06180 [Caproiciproducens sp.]|jgi:hypothetical protein|nr:hypothetical protein [Caproiciproducens sp.]HEX3039865.1 hypothetical protein [Caproiciproducens sp.]